MSHIPSRLMWPDHVHDADHHMRTAKVARQAIVEIEGRLVAGRVTERGRKLARQFENMIADMQTALTEIEQDADSEHVEPNLSLFDAGLGRADADRDLQLGDAA